MSNLARSEHSSNIETQFFELLDNFSEGAQDYIAILSSSFLERDEYDRYVREKPKRRMVVDALREEGLQDKQIRVVLRSFGLPIDVLRKEKQEVPYQRRTRER